MKLYLAVAVLMLASLACTEAQEETFQDKLATFGQQVARVGQNLAQKAKATFDQIHNSEMMTNSRSFFQDQFDKIKTSLQENFN